MKIRSRKSTTWVYVLVGALVVLATMLVLLASYLIERNTVETTIELLTPEAFKNPKLAISLLGKRYGVSVQSNWNLVADDMPDLSNTIVLEDIRSAVAGKNESDALDAWVRKGGTLIYEVPTLSFDEDLQSIESSEFFPFNLMVYNVKETSWVLEIFRQWTGEIKLDCSSSTSLIQFGHEDVAEHEGEPWNNLHYSQSPYANNLHPLSVNHFFHLNYGQGQIYLAADLDLWSNQRVDCADNAYVFMRMVLGTKDLELSEVNLASVWIVPRDPADIPNLLTLTWNNFHVTIIGFFLTFVVVLIARNVRCSPAIHAIPIPRRATVDYVTSATDFAWRKNKIRHFFQALRWVSENPSGIFGPEKAYIAKQSQADSNISTVINMNPSNEEELVRSVRAFQTELRQNLQPTLRQS